METMAAWTLMAALFLSGMFAQAGLTSVIALLGLPLVWAVAFARNSRDSILIFLASLIAIAASSTLPVEYQPFAHMVLWLASFAWAVLSRDNEHSLAPRRRNKGTYDGIVLYDGEHLLPFGDGLFAAPFPSLRS